MTSRTPQEDQALFDAAIADADSALAPLAQLATLGEYAANAGNIGVVREDDNREYPWNEASEHPLGIQLYPDAAERLGVQPVRRSTFSSSTTIQRGLDKTVPGGLFITLEGLESSGKSTQGKRLKAHLESHGYQVVLVGEPGGTEYGQAARELFLKNHQDMVPEAEVGLLLTCKAQLLKKVIEPALAEGKIVICDRYTDTLFAYQHHAKGHSRAMMEDLLIAFRADRMPDFTLLLRIDPEVSVRRSWERKNAGGDYSSFDAAPTEFHYAVSIGLFKEVTARPGQYGVVNGERSEDEVFHDAVTFVRNEVANRISHPEGGCIEWGGQASQEAA